MEQIAAAAGVAVQTVFYTFKTKGQLLTEVVEVNAAGDDDPVPASRRAWLQEMLASSSPQRVLALGVENGTGIYERVALLWPAVGAAAATDPAVETYWLGVIANRRAANAAWWPGSPSSEAFAPGWMPSGRPTWSSCSPGPTYTADWCRKLAGPSPPTRPGSSLL
jgi:AcrR family transcriptional regulator